MSFVYGVEEGAIGPLKISLRGEDAETLVYDDLLARSTCHLNAVPTDVHLSDWRPLLVRPAAARSLLTRLDDACWRAVEKQFFGDATWRGKFLRPGAADSAQDLRKHAIAALNAVPSQYQLHLHYIMPPFLPVDYHLLLRGERFTRGRWLPIEYVHAALDVLEKVGGLPDAPSMEHEDIFGVIEAHGGPNYDEALLANRKKACDSHEALANWREDCFEHVAILCPGPSDLAYEIHAISDQQLGSVVDGASAKDTEKSDKKLLQSYGRPYSADGKPAPTSYYSFAKQPGEVTSEETWMAADKAPAPDGLQLLRGAPP